MKTILYKIPLSEIPFLLNQLGQAYYWVPASSKLLHWDGHLEQTEHEVGDDPLSTLPEFPITGTIVVNGILDQGITAKVVHQICYASLRSINQRWILTMPKGDIPPDLAPFVEPKTWTLPTTIEVSDYLKAKGIYSERLLRACLGLYQGELEMALRDAEDIEDAVSRYKRRKLQSRGIMHIPQPDCLAVGCENIITLIDKVGKSLLPEAEVAGLPFPKGIIMMGPPGTGKSLGAKTAATRLGVPLICADWGGLISPEPGQSEENMRALIETAEATAPCILFFDDFDKAFASADLSQENGTEKRLAGYLLTWLQERTARVFCIVTCNRITHLPPELKRRFDWQVFVDLPHEGSRFEIFKVHLARFCGAVPEWELYDWKRLINEYNECTPDEIAKAVHQAAFNAFERGTPRQVSLEDLLEQRLMFTPANLANPEQIEAIRLNSRYAMKAASDDNSVFRVESVDAFKSLLRR